MKKLEPYPVALALFFIFTVFYAVCIGLKLLLDGIGVEGILHMHKLWVLILPWFGGLDSLSIIIGLLEVSLGSYLIGYIIVPVYNFLIRNKVREHKIEVKPIILRFKTLFVSIVLFAVILFALCLVYDLIVPADYQMLSFWEILLPGFSGLTFLSYMIGVCVIIIYSAYVSFILSKTLNYFEKSELKKANDTSLSDISSEISLNNPGEEKLQTRTKKYDEKYFGIAAGVFAAIIFLIAAIKMVFSGNDFSGIIKPFIPFFTSVNVLNIIGGIIAAFVWGWIIGYFFMKIYHWIDRQFSR